MTRDIKKPGLSVWFYVPNLIGYVRVILSLSALLLSNTAPLLFVVCYGLSELLDSFDGYAARALDQSTRYGAVLDMVTDRSSTAMLLVVLTHYYPDWTRTFALLIALDLTSHYAHLYSSLSKGLTSHKHTDVKMFRLLRLYYGNKYLMYVLCFGNEAAFVALYMLHFPSLHFTRELSAWLGITHPLPWILFRLALPICTAKQLMNLLQLVQASLDTVEIDRKDHSKKHAAADDVVVETHESAARAKSPSRGMSKSPAAAAGRRRSVRE